MNNTSNTDNIRDAVVQAHHKLVQEELNFHNLPFLIFFCLECIAFPIFIGSLYHSWLLSFALLLGVVVLLKYFPIIAAIALALSFSAYWTYHVYLICPWPLCTFFAGFLIFGIHCAALNYNRDA